jgi:hypothetical protein
MRVTVNRRAAMDDARLAVFELGNCFLNVYRTGFNKTGLKPTHAIIVLTVAISTIQKYVRVSTSDPVYRAAVPLPDALAGGISRRAIARATGLPTETVRRGVEELVALGRLEILTAQKVRAPLGSISWLAAEDLEAMLVAVARQAEALARAGILEIRPDQQASDSNNSPAH